MTKPPAPEIGKPMLLPADTGVVLAPMEPFNNPGCRPPGSNCPSFHAVDIQSAVNLSDIRLLVLEIDSAKKQHLDLWIEIATDDYSSLLFMTKKQAVPVQADKNTLVGLDPEAAEAAQPYFVSGNTVTLAVRPRGAGVTVKVGKIVSC